MERDFQGNSEAKIEDSKHDAMYVTVSAYDSLARGEWIASVFAPYIWQASPKAEPLWATSGELRRFATDLLTVAAEIDALNRARLNQAVKALQADGVDFSHTESGRRIIAALDI